MKKTLPHFATLADAQQSPDMPLQEFTVNWFLSKIGHLHLTLSEDLKNGCNYVAQLGKTTVASVFISKVNTSILVSAIPTKKAKTLKGSLISSEELNSLYVHADFLGVPLRPLKVGGKYLQGAGNAFVFSADFKKGLEGYNGNCPIKTSELVVVASVLSLDTATEATISLLSIQGSFTLALVVGEAELGKNSPLTVRVFTRDANTEDNLKNCKNVQEQAALLKTWATDSWQFDYKLKTWKEESLNADNME